MKLYSSHLSVPAAMDLRLRRSGARINFSAILALDVTCDRQNRQGSQLLVLSGREPFDATTTAALACCSPSKSRTVKGYRPARFGEGAQPAPVSIGKSTAAESWLLRERLRTRGRNRADAGAGQLG